MITNGKCRLLAKFKFTNIAEIFWLTRFRRVRRDHVYYINNYNIVGLKWELISENKEQKYKLWIEALWLEALWLEAQLVSFIICHFFTTRFKF